MHRGTMEHPVAPWSTTMRRVFHPETNGVKASPHRHKRVLSHGAPADPSDPWNIHAAPVSPPPKLVLESLSHRCTMEHHDATAVTTPRQTVKATAAHLKFLSLWPPARLGTS